LVALSLLGCTSKQTAVEEVREIVQQHLATFEHDDPYYRKLNTSDILNRFDFHQKRPGQELFLSENWPSYLSSPVSRSIMIMVDDNGVRHTQWMVVFEQEDSLFFKSMDTHDNFKTFNRVKNEEWIENFREYHDEWLLEPCTHCILMIAIIRDRQSMTVKVGELNNTNPSAEIMSSLGFEFGE